MTPAWALFLIDLLSVSAGWPSTLWIAGADWRHDWFPLLAFPLTDLVCFYALGLYRRDSIADISDALERVPVIVVIAVAGASLVAAAFGWPFSLSLSIAGVVCFTVSAVLARLIFKALRRHSVFRTRLLIIGAGKRAWDLVWILRTQGRFWQYDLTFVHEDSFGAIDERLAADSSNRIIVASSNLLKIASRVRADEIVVAPDDRRGMALESLITCRAAGYPVSEYASFLEKEVCRIDIKRLDLAWLLYSEGFRTGRLTAAFKRLFDIAGSLAILIPVSPFLLLAMAAVWLGDRGPVFYRQERVTRRGRNFRILKLRTMRVNAESGGAVWAAAKDSRITPVGEFLRRSRLDEVPQLLNVLWGDMSLVGPRPERPEFIEDLAKMLPLYHERHAVKAGLTGWAQVNYPYGASLDDARSKLSYDLYYVKNYSLFFDLRIVMQTLRVVLWPGSGVR
ncbi:MAG: TIGR03013 family PEP-CTERM/XrtA system glycosyltransferase [Proteobacteria bacterium]|nr:TIGR03013 family PEP-CTERM/XrtA system glycosyltransferase [Pseudomonadota bacterium]